MDGLNDNLPGPSPMAKSPWTWDEMIEAFRALGGTAENIALGNGALGRGIFALDRTKPIHLHVPANLLFPVDGIEFADNRIRIKKSTEVGVAERDFFETYHDTFSWGGGGHSECAAFIEALDSLPPDVRALLVSDFGMAERFQGNSVERTQQWFLQSRPVQRNEKKVLMPVLELANHAVDGLDYDRTDGISIEGKCADEVLVGYTDTDPLRVFLSWGFASPEPVAFSLPLTMNLGGRQLIVEWNPSLNSKRGDFSTPQLQFDGDRIVLSYLMIGHAKAPRLSRGTFCTLMREAGLANIDETFDQIVYSNRMKFLNLLAALEADGGGLIVPLRTMARYQLQAMSHCIGTREL